MKTKNQREAKKGEERENESKRGREGREHKMRGKEQNKTLMMCLDEAIQEGDSFIWRIEILYNKMLCLDREIKKNLKCMHFFEVFQLAKLERIQIPSKKVEFEILLTQPHTLDSIPNGPSKLDNHDRLGWPGQTLQTDQTNLTTQTGRASPMTQKGRAGPITQTDRGHLMTHTGQAGLTTQTGQRIRWPKQDGQT